MDVFIVGAYITEFVASEKIVVGRSGASLLPLFLRPQPLSALMEASFALHDSSLQPVPATTVVDPTIDNATMLFNGAGRPVMPNFNAIKAIVPLDRFKANWNALTQRSFDALGPADWNNIVVAGGAVLHCLMPDFHPSQRPNTDIDLFIYGLDAVQARAKVERLFNLISSTPGCTGNKSVMALRTPNTVTFVLPAPKKHIQIVLRLHSSADEVISCFDVDCCGVMYDGVEVRATTRAAKAIATRVNIAVAERRSWTYESRLIKYAKRGYAIAVPGLDMTKVDRDSYIFERDDPRWWSYREAMDQYFEATGLRKLLIANEAGFEVFKENRRTKFVMSSGSTRELARFIMEAGEHYGPSLPDVPGAGKYAIERNVKPFFTRTNSPSAIVFKMGGIPTGVAEVGADPNWWARVHDPPVNVNIPTSPPSGGAGSSSNGAGSSPENMPGTSKDNEIVLD